LGRRALLGAAGGFACLSAEAAAQGRAERRLRLELVNTNESCDLVYWKNGTYLPEALRRLDWLCRDHRAEQATRMDPRLFDLLHALAQRMGSTEAYRVISAYRSPGTNAMRRRQTRGVAQGSLHMSGMAADVMLPGRDANGLAREAALLTGANGVGLYRRDGFVHIDCGPDRRW
jgi:uncharacterized protein YcbK (DUF882 family)